MCFVSFSVDCFHVLAYYFYQIFNHSLNYVFPIMVQFLFLLTILFLFDECKGGDKVNNIERKLILVLLNFNYIKQKPCYVIWGVILVYK